MVRDQKAQDRGEKPGKSIIDGDKITIDFDKLSSDMLSFKVRAGSLIETREEEERRNIQEMLVPVSQMMGNISEGNRDAFEQNIMQMISRLFELSNIDVSAQTANRIDDKLLLQAQRATMEEVMNQGQQIQQLAQMMQAQQPAQPSGPQRGTQPGQREPIPVMSAPQQGGEGLTPGLQQGVSSEANGGQAPTPPGNLQ